MVESVPRKTIQHRNRSNTPSQTPQDHYKLMVAIPLLDSLINQLEDRFEGEGRQCHILLCHVLYHLLLSKNCCLQLPE